MRKLVVSGVMFLLLISTLVATVKIRSAKAEWTGTVYIRANGQVDPVTAPITVVDNKTYVFIGDITGSLIVERDSIIVDGAGHIIEGTDKGINLNKNYVEIKNLVVKGFRYGIHLYTDNNIIHDNTVLNCQYGIYLSTNSETNKVFRNKVNGNNYGIFIDGVDNRIYGNIIKSNNYAIRVFGDDAKIFANFIEDNQYGLYLDQYSGNTHVYHNAFLSNNYQISGDYRLAKYDDGYPSGGNFWDGYAGVDADGDGIGDIPYSIGSSVQDGYPLIAPLYLCYAGTWEGVDYYVEIISNSQISNFQFNPEGVYIKFDFEGTTGFCRVTIPKNLLWAEDGWTVRIDGQNVNYKIIPHATKTFLAFSYSGREAQIYGTGSIPEFPSTLILALFMPAILFETILLKIKKKRRFP